MLLGVITLALFFVVEALSRSGHADAAATLAVPMRILIIPMYIVWLPFTMLTVALIGPDASPAVIAGLLRICGLIAGFLPYVFADYALEQFRRAMNLRDAGSKAPAPRGQS